MFWTLDGALTFLIRLLTLPFEFGIGGSEQAFRCFCQRLQSQNV